MTDIYCLIDGDPLSLAFPVTESLDDCTVGRFKECIKERNAISFSDVDARNLVLWHVTIPIPENENQKQVPIWLDEIAPKDKTILATPRNSLAAAFKGASPETIYIIVRRRQ
ncbi:hypothetical protein BGZ83_002239, partial [Gryganskiella cystojenkinii]